MSKIIQIIKLFSLCLYRNHFDNDDQANDSSPDNANNVFLTQNESVSDSGSNASSTVVTKLPQINATTST
jgi:hypothetical protein